MAEQHLLQRLKVTLWLAMSILLVAEIICVLQTVLGSVASVVVTIIVFSVQWFTGRYFKKNVWARIASQLLRLVIIFAPLVYMLVKIFVFNSNTLWLQLLLVLSFIGPLLLMFYASRMVQQLLDARASTATADSIS